MLLISKRIPHGQFDQGGKDTYRLHGPILGGHAVDGSASGSGVKEVTNRLKAERTTHKLDAHNGQDVQDSSLEGGVDLRDTHSR